MIISRKICIGLMVFGIFFCSCRKKGCKDPSSLAYNSEARKDDGSCTYPENIKRALVFKASATWCEECGLSGKSFSDDITSTYPNAQIIEIHRNDDLSSNVGSLLRAYLDTVNIFSGVPSFYIGTERIDSNNYSLLSSSVNSEISEASEVNLALNHNFNDSTLNINIHSQLANGFNGTSCYLAVYIMEDGVVKPQEIDGYIDPVSGTNFDQNFVHDNILRAEASASASPFGVPIVFRSDGNNIISYNSINLQPSTIWNYSNLYIVAVIWQKNGDDFRFINYVRSTSLS